MKDYGLILAGKVQSAHSNDWFEVQSPSTEKSFARVARAGAEDVDQAVKAAQQGFIAWSSLAPKEREGIKIYIEFLS